MGVGVVTFGLGVGVCSWVGVGVFEGVGDFRGVIILLGIKTKVGDGVVSLEGGVNSGITEGDGTAVGLKKEFGVVVCQLKLADFCRAVREYPRFG